MYLENIVVDALDPQLVGRFWEAVVGGEKLTDEPGIYETRLAVDGGPVLDLCFQQVGDAPTARSRLHLDLAGGTRQAEEVDRLLGLGARRLDIGQGEVPWVVLADPDGNAFCVMEERAAYRDTGPIAALPLDCIDPERDAQLYAALTGWVPAPGIGVVTLRHPSMRGPLLEFCPEPVPKQHQNRTHPDVRPEPDGPDQAGLVELACSLGATRASEDWAQGHSWVVMRDASGNEFCVLSDP